MALVSRRAVLLGIAAGTAAVMVARAKPLVSFPIWTGPTAFAAGEIKTEHGLLPGFGIQVKSKGFYGFAYHDEQDSLLIIVADNTVGHFWPQQGNPATQEHPRTPGPSHAAPVAPRPLAQE